MNSTIEIVSLSSLSDFRFRFRDLALNALDGLSTTGISESKAIHTSSSVSSSMRLVSPA
jgi:hypothetical protein